MNIIAVLLFAALLVLLQRVIYKKYWNRALSLKLTFSANQAHEGDSLVLTEELTNAKPLPLPWVTAKFSISRNLIFTHKQNSAVTDDYYQQDLFCVNMYQRVTRRLSFVCGRRGFYQIKSMDLSASDILSTQKLVSRLQSNAELTVLPRLIPIEEIEIAVRQIFGDVEVRRFTNPDPFQFCGIREYLPRDDFRYINFKASARTGGLMVNRYGETASQELIILLNLQTYSDWTHNEIYEESIRIAASVAGMFGDLGLAVGIHSGGKDTVTDSTLNILPGCGERHFHGILEQLARITLAKKPSPIAPVLDNLRATEPVYLMISPCHDDYTVESFRNVLERGLSVHWILPALKDTLLRLPDDIEVTRWDVDLLDYKQSSTISVDLPPSDLEVPS